MTDGSPLVDLDAPAPAASRDGRLLPWLWILVGALLIAGVVSAFVVDGEPAPGERLAAAAASVEESGPFSYALVVESSGPFAGDVTIDGAIDPAVARFTSTFQVAGTTVEMIGDGDVLYLQVPEGQRESFGGKPWARLDAAALGAGFGGVSPSASPVQTFEQLREAGEVETVGEEEVRGVATTHFRTVFDLSGSVPDGPGTAEVRKALEAVDVDVWLDSDDRVRRHRTSIDLGTAVGAGAGFTIITTIETFDFGKAVAIEVPPPDQVADADAGALQSLFAPPPSAPAPAD